MCENRFKHREGNIHSDRLPEAIAGYALVFENRRIDGATAAAAPSQAHVNQAQHGGR